MLCGRFPFWGKTDIEYMKSLSRGPCMVGDGWDEVSKEGKTFLKQMLQIDPKKRLTADQALSHSWLTRTAPSLNRKLSSISGLAVIASANKAKISVKECKPDGVCKAKCESKGEVASEENLDTSNEA